MKTKIAVSMLFVLNWVLIYRFMFVAVPLRIENGRQAQIGRLMEEFHLPAELARNFCDIGADTRVDPFLLCSIAKTESSFRLDAVSPKNYKGILQTPFATMKWADVDILIGAEILKHKLRISRGDLLRALQLYKGGDNPEALAEAKEVMRIYNLSRRD